MQDNRDSFIINVFKTNTEYFRVIREFHRSRGPAVIDSMEKNLIDRLIGRRMLDAGCGEGSITKWLVDRFPGVSAVGVDCSGVALDMARSGSSGYPAERLSWVEASIKSLPFEDSSFDFIICHSVLEHIPDYPAALKEFSRVLKAGGRLVILTSNSGRFEHRAICALYKLFMGTTTETALNPSFVQRDGSLEDNQANFDITRIWSNMMLRRLKENGFRILHFTTYRQAVWSSPVYMDSGFLTRLLIRIAYTLPFFPFTHLGPKILAGCEKICPHNANKGEY